MHLIDRRFKISQYIQQEKKGEELYYSPLTGIGFRLRLDILKIQYYIAFSQAHIKTWEE